MGLMGLRFFGAMCYVNSAQNYLFPKEDMGTWGGRIASGFFLVPGY